MNLHLVIHFFFCHIFAILQIRNDKPILSGCGNQSTWRKSKSQFTGNFLTCSGKDSDLDSGERQLAVSGNALDHTIIMAGPKNLYIYSIDNILEYISIATKQIDFSSFSIWKYNNRGLLASSHVCIISSSPALLSPEYRVVRLLAR